MIISDLTLGNASQQIHLITQNPHCFDENAELWPFKLGVKFSRSWITGGYFLIEL